MRRRAPVSDRPVISPARRVTSLPCQGDALSLAVADVVAGPAGPGVFVGIDWASAVHAVCVLDPSGRKLAAFRVEHTADGLAGLVRRLARWGEPEAVPVAVERPDGRLVDALLEAGHPVVPVKPNAIKAWRDAEVLSGAKSDD